MVAEVIKLPSSTPSSFQPTNIGGSVGVIPAPTNGAQPNVPNQSARFAEQAANNIEVVRKAANELNKFAGQIQTNLKFSVDEPSGKSVITVTDSETGEVIRQIPAKEVLAVANLLREFATSDIDKVGLLLTDKG